MPRSNVKLLNPKRNSLLILLRRCLMTGLFTNKTSERRCGSWPMSWRWWNSTSCRSLTTILVSPSTLKSKELMAELNNALKSSRPMSPSPNPLRTLSKNSVHSKSKSLNMRKNSLPGKHKSTLLNRNILLVIITSSLRLKSNLNGSSRINSVSTMTKLPRNNSLPLLRNTVEWRLTMTSRTSLTRPTLISSVSRTFNLNSALWVNCQSLVKLERWSSTLVNFVVLNDDLVISDKFKKLLLIIFYLTFENLRLQNFKIIIHSLTHIYNYHYKNLNTH